MFANPFFKRKRFLRNAYRPQLNCIFMIPQMRRLRNSLMLQILFENYFLLLISYKKIKKSNKKNTF